MMNPIGQTFKIDGGHETIPEGTMVTVMGWKSMAWLFVQYNVRAEDGKDKVMFGEVPLEVARKKINSQKDV